MLPNFLICGAHKAGTSSLYEYLKSHPDIFMSIVKELHFFSESYEKGRPWYEGYFSGYRGQRAIGEASTTYMSDPEVPRRIAEFIPDIRLIFVLRNPIERAHSEYWHRIQVGFQNPIQPFREAIRTQENYKVYIKEGFYYEHLRHFNFYFNRDRLRVVISEDLKSNPLRELPGCFQFLGVDTGYVPDIGKLHNVTRYPRSLFLFKKLYKLWKPVKKHIWPFFPEGMKNFKKRVHGSFFVNGKKPPMKEEDRRYLREIYREQNRLLSDFLGRDLSFWE